MGAGTASIVAGESVNLITLGIVTALPGEARILAGQKCKPLARMRLHQNVHLQLSGMGVVAARQAAGSLINAGAEALVSWGCAGALQSDLAAGELFLPATVVNAQDQPYATDSMWRASLIKALGHPDTNTTLYTSETPLSSVQAKAHCHQATHAQAVDMESAGIAAVAQAHGMPFLVVRAIADTAQCGVPHAAMQSLSNSGDFLPWSLFKSLSKSPGQLGALINLGRGFRMAQASLARVVASVGPRLAYNESWNALGDDS